MTSNFSDTKIALDTAFFNGWLTTPIHFDGMNFDITAQSEWIHLVYQYRDCVSLSLSNTNSYSRGVFYVVCWGSTPLEATKLSDDVVAFFNANKPTDISYKRYEISDQGVSNNKNFVVLAFNIESYINVVC